MWFPPFLFSSSFCTVEYKSGWLCFDKISFFFCLDDFVPPKQNLPFSFLLSFELRCIYDAYSFAPSLSSSSYIHHIFVCRAAAGCTYIHRCAALSNWSEKRTGDESFPDVTRCFPWPSNLASHVLHLFKTATTSVSIWIFFHFCSDSRSRIESNIIYQRQLGDIWDMCQKYTISLFLLADVDVRFEISLLRSYHFWYFVQIGKWKKKRKYFFFLPLDCVSTYCHVWIYLCPARSSYIYTQFAYWLYLGLSNRISALLFYW